nr:MAG: major capsid protein [Microviridae sp.]
MVRMAPMTFPIMQQLDIAVHYFYVPNRLLFDSSADWEAFISPQATAKNPNPRETTPPTYDLNPNTEFGLPQQFFKEGELLDFLGYNKYDNADVTKSLLAHILPVNAYNLIYYNYYMDQNVSDSPNMKKILGKPGLHDPSSDGSDLSAQGESLQKYFSLRNRCWKKDYFTSSLPFTQRGADVHLPLYGKMPIKNYAGSIGIQSTSTPSENSNFQVNYNPSNNKLKFGSNNQYEINQTLNLNQLSGALYGDLTNATAATINELRKATALQRFLEISARCGSRYKEFVLGHFGVDVPDGRLQRPEFLGGGTCKMQISEVLQTSSSVTSEGGDVTSPLADMAGHGIAFGKTNYCKKSFPEHGYVMAIMSIIPRAGYYQGVRKDLLKQDRLDFYSPEFAHLGEQPIELAEIFTGGNADEYDPHSTFGYTPRYAEYKFIPNQIHGTFKTNMDAWHMARKFDTAPTLSKEFMEVNEYANGLNRVFAVPGTNQSPIEHFYVYAFNDVRALRPMPVFGTPSII